jgi:hypothetical protein
LPCRKGELTPYIAQAVRGWKLITEYKAKYEDSSYPDPFRIRDEDTIICNAIAIAGIQAVIEDNYGDGELDKVAGGFSQRNLVNKRRNLRALGKRFAAAIFGGMVLIGPMLLMVLYKDRTTDLATTSVAGTVERSSGDRSHPLARDSFELVLELDLVWLQGLVAVEQMDSQPADHVMVDDHAN